MLSAGRDLVHRPVMEALAQTKVQSSRSWTLDFESRSDDWSHFRRFKTFFKYRNLQQVSLPDLLFQTVSVEFYLNIIRWKSRNDLRRPQWHRAMFTSCTTYTRTSERTESHREPLPVDRSTLNPCQVQQAQDFKDESQISTSCYFFYFEEQVQVQNSF